MKLLGKLLHDPLDRWAQRKVQREKVLVTDGVEATRGLLARGGLRLVVGLSALMGAQLLPEPYDTFAWGLLGGLVGAGALVSLNKASAYRSGWLDGRQRVLQDITKIRSADELVAVVSHTAEYDTVHVLGMPSYTVVIPDSPEGLE